MFFAFLLHLVTHSLSDIKYILLVVLGFTKKNEYIFIYLYMIKYINITNLIYR